MPTDDRDPVDVLAEEFADRLRRGEHPSVSDYAAAHPEHAEQLKELLPAVAQMEMLKRFRHPTAPEQKSLPDHFGDFRIIRELGRGGMGVVFEAVQESLGRPVALKVLARHAQLDRTRRERFVREAQAAAKLHHTNIVPVFGVGEQDGLPYYVMQLIPGSGLHSIVWQWRKESGADEGVEGKLETRGKNPGTKPAGESGATSLEDGVRAPAYGDWRFVAEVAIRAAHALHYAHRHGVLHRDVKPANLIYDGQTVWVADFGLAKLTNADGLTSTGDILGTLQYLPPECLTGIADARSDVYGLGATLYELLTLEPPYTADSPARLIKQVADSDPPPPRSVNPGIPRDLETIVLKAMSRDPRTRYVTALDLAEDLEAFLDDRPIKARRTSPLSRAWRWCRRNPAVASLTLSTIAALLLAAVAGWVGYARAEDRRKNEVHARQEEHKAKDDALRAKEEAQKLSQRLEDNLELSIESFGDLIAATSGIDRQGYVIPLPPPDRLGGPGGPGGPKGPPPGGPKKDGFGPKGWDGPNGEMSTDKAAVLEAVLAFYDKLVDKNALTPDLQFAAAKASRRVCEVYVVMLKKPKEAVVAFRRAAGLLEPLVAQSPEKQEWRAELVMAYLVAPPEAFPNDRDAPTRRAIEVAKGDPKLIGLVHLRLGFAREQAKDSPRAEAAYREAIAALSSVPPSRRSEHLHIDLASARFQLANLLQGQRNSQAAREVLDASVEEYRPFAEQFAVSSPEQPVPFHVGREWMWHTYNKLSDVSSQMGDQDSANEARRNRDKFGFGPPGMKKENFGPGGKKDGPPPRKDGFGPPKKDDFGPPGFKDEPND